MMAVAPSLEKQVVEALGRRSIVLIGLMGAGKSSIGRRLAARLGLHFVDADTEIEAAAGMTNAEILQMYGEQDLRSGEERVIARLLEQDSLVLATGYRAFLSKTTRDTIQQRGISVWLKADFEVLMRRIKRRLTDNEPKTDPQRIRHLIAQNYPIYAAADLTIEARDVPHEVMLNELVTGLAQMVAPLGANPSAAAEVSEDEKQSREAAGGKHDNEETKAAEALQREIDYYEVPKSRQREEELSKEKEQLKFILPIFETIPDQSTKAISFTSSEIGPLALVPDRPNDQIDPEQEQLYRRMRQQLAALTGTIPSQERAQVSSEIDDFLNQPSEWKEIRYKKVLWLCGNALRNVLAQHDIASLDADPHYAKLPPILAEALRRPIETWNVVVLGDPTLRELDSIRLGPNEAREGQDELLTAQQFIKAAADDPGIITSEAATALRAALAAAALPADTVHTRQAQELARGTTQNLVVQILRGGHRIASELQDPTSEESKTFAKEYKAGIYKEMASWTVRGAIAGAAATTYLYGVPFFEFVVTQGPWLKAYLVVAFQNPELVRIVDVITAIREKMSKASK
jgi:shikimate kinase